MTHLIPTLLPLLLSAVNVAPAQVPAIGKQEAVVTLDAPAMVRMAARSASGTSCTVVDRVRGPFTTSGQTGKTNCELDLLLDIGSYKLRLDSAHRGKGKVDISAKAFTEVNAKPLKLEENKGAFEQTLHTGEQASFWLSLPKRDYPHHLRVFGRTAGMVKIWRNGDWLEEVPLSHVAFVPESGRALHEWTLGRTLEAGDYLITVYGTDVKPWAGSGVSDAVSIEYGFRPGPAERSLAFTLPASGFLAAQIPNVPTAALLSMDAAPAQQVSMQLGDLSTGTLGYGSTCTVEPKQLVPGCSTFAGGDSPHVLMIRGGPGARGTVEWTTLGTSGVIWNGGWYGSSQTQILFNGSNGDTLLGVHDLPVDTDSAPLGCQLEKLNQKGEPEVIARDVMSLDDGQMLDNSFNYDGNGAVVWFEVKKSERFRIQTKGDRKSRCEVYRHNDDGSLKRLTESKNGALCNESLVLARGTYQVSLYDGLSGIERLVVREDNQRPLKPVATKAGCLLTAETASGRYRLVLTRNGSITARGLLEEKLPLTLEGPLHLTLDAHRTLKLPLTAGLVATVRSSAGAAFKCGFGAAIADARDGACILGAAGKDDALTLTNPGDAVIGITLMKPPKPPPAPAVFASWAPGSHPLQVVPLDTPTFFDFDRGESHSMVFDVDKAGLYNVTTVGLLTTACRIRTPVVPSVAGDSSSSGRGRNCLVSGYLRPGRYMVTATTVGTSRGRAGVLMTRRNPKEFAPVTADGDAFFRVDPGELVQQKLNVKSAGSYALGTTGQGVSLMCRLDDAQGWPLEPVPSNCVGNRYLTPGSYLWTQLPLTVESMRRTRLEKVKEAVVLSGNKPHPIEFHTWYSAKLGPDGKDEFLFKLEGELQLSVSLTAGMQGRLFLLETDKQPRAVEVIPPQARYEEPRSGGEGEESEAPRRNYDEGEGEREDSYNGGGDEGEGNNSAQREEDPGTTAGVAPVQAVKPPPPPAGVRITLPAGQYKLVTEHSRGNVGVEYQLQISSETMVPGMTRTLPTPTTIDVKIPRDGTLRLRTEGEADVRCRLFDDRNQLVFENSENGADWNCSLAEPIVKGHYSLVLESETQQRGETKLTLALAPVEDKGLVTDGAALKLGASVQTLSIPVAEKDAVAELSFKSKTPISCALEDGTGAVVHRKTRVLECALLVRPMLERFRVRLWTTDGTAQVTALYKPRIVAPFEKGTLGAGQAGIVALPHPGRYRTSPQMFCLPALGRGLLKSCGPEVSLEAGPTVFAAFGAAPSGLPLDEVTSSETAKVETAPIGLSRQPYLQKLTASGPSIFLAAGEVQHGERTSPSCAFDGAGTVREGRDSTCFAATGLTSSTVARAWAPTPQDLPLNAKLSFRALKLPAKAEALVPGRRRLNWVEEAGAFTLPTTARARLELTLPTDAWAILLDDKNAALDFCPPSGSLLARCVLTGKGGRLVLVSGEPMVDVTTVLLDAPERNYSFTVLFEDSPRVPGTMRLRIPPGDGERTIAAEGNVERCTIALSDGVRIAGCRGTVPNGIGAELLVEHRVGAMRAVVFPSGRDRWARLGIELPVIPGPGLSAAIAVPVTGSRMDRTLVIEKDSIVRVTAESGVCALFKGNDLLSVDGMDAGCELVRLLSPGSYRIVVRPFAGQTAPGLLRWTSEPVVALKDGVGPEEWIAPAEVRVYRFQTASTGRVGLGIQAKAESLDCAVYDDGYRLLGEGCQQYLALERGNYLLTVRQPPRSGNQALRFKPVLVGLAGAKTDVPEDYLKDLFSRIGVSK